MELIMIRHLATEGNRKRQYIGSTDEELDAESYRAPLPSYPDVEIVIASPMKRCVQTARFLYPEKKILEWEEFRECDFGLFEGKTYEELKDLPEYRNWLDSGGRYAFPRGENMEVFRDRCERGMERLVRTLARMSCGRAAVVAHGGTIMALLSSYDPEGREFYRWQTPNGHGYQVYLDETAWMQGEKRLVEMKKI